MLTIQNKSGFTLAEALIVVGILGIIAAVTVPVASIRFQQHVLGNQLAKAVEQIEIGFANIFEQANSNTPDGSAFTSLLPITRRDIFGANVANGGDSITTNNNLLVITGGLFGVRSISQDDNEEYVANIRENGAAPYSIDNSWTIYGNDKLSFYLMIPSNGIQRIGDNNINDIIIDTAIIDVNGKERPNSVGKDIFLFGISESGKLIPAGTQTFNDKVVNDLQVPLESVACTDANMNNYLSCTARVVRENYEITYK